MFTLLTRWMLLGLTGFAILLSLTRTQPYRPLATEGLPGPRPGCEAPCFMGIEVGKATSEQAMLLLSEHPWVDHSTIRRMFENQYIQWGWSGQQAGYIDARIPGGAQINGTRVISIAIATRISIGDWLLQLGQPTSMESGSALGPDGRWSFFSLGFSEPSLYLSYSINACDWVSQIWSLQSVMEIRPVYPPWDDLTQTESMDSFIQRLFLLRERNCRR